MSRRYKTLCNFLIQPPNTTSSSHFLQTDLCTIPNRRDRLYRLASVARLITYLPHRPRTDNPRIMHPSSVIFLSILPFLSQVLCVPAAQDVSHLKRQNAPAPGSMIPCPIGDGRCQCFQNYDGSVEYLCGYVDMDWNNRTTSSAATKLKRDDGGDDTSAEQSLDALTHAVVDNPDFPAGLSRRGDGALDFAQPQVLFADDCVLDALRLLTPDAFVGAESVIRNRDSWATRGQFVQGLVGTFLSPKAIRRPFPTGADWEGQPFPAGTLWAMRWDFSWFGPNHTFPAIGMLGPHVRLDIRAPDNAANNISLAFFPKSDTAMAKAEHAGDFYYSNILLDLRNSSGWDNNTSKYPVNEVFGSRALGDFWYKSFIAHGGVPISPDPVANASITANTTSSVTSST